MSNWQERPSRTYPLTFIRPPQTGAGEFLNWWIDGREPEGLLSPIIDEGTRQFAGRLRMAFEPAHREAILRKAYRCLHEQAIEIPLLGGVLIHAFNQRVDWDSIPGSLYVWHSWRTKWMPGAP